MKNAEPLMEIRNLSKVFGRVRALDNVSFNLYAGEVHGFIGPNGAGKTTAMRIIAGMEQADAGDVLFRGDSVALHPEKCRRFVGFMPDYLDSYANILVWEYLDFYGRIYGAPPADRRRRCADVVAFTGLGDTLERPVEGLSKGWKQRLSLARVLLNDPQVLILDEPAAGLDPRARIELRDMVILLAKHGKAVFVSSHILGELAEMCNSVTIIQDGRLRSSCGVDSLRRIVDKGRRMAVTLLEPAPEDIRKLILFLAQIPGVNDAQAVAGGALFSYEGAAAFKFDLLRGLLDGGFRVTDFHSATSSLEEVFMAVTGEPGERSRS